MNSESNKYQFSIITPFHNADMELFAECEKSMRRQSIGFENIEWIIVLHNCDAHYKPLMYEKFKDDENVVLIVLDDDYHTPSSPRNRGIQVATAEYIGFLDADDRYTEQCMEVVKQEFDETGADMVNVRRQSISKCAIALPFRIKMPFNNTNRHAIIEQGHWRKEMFNTPFWGFCTSMFYCRYLLHSNNITFNLSIPFCEDYYFVLQCIAHAKRISYMNQFVGYVYVQHEQSIVQNIIKPANTIVNIAEGFSKILLLMNNYRLPTQSLILQKSLMARYAIFSPDMTFAQRLKIKGSLEKSISSNSSLYEDDKYFNGAEKMIMDMVTSYILSPELDPKALTRANIDGIQELRIILFNEKDTDYGKRNDFENIKTVEAYRFRVPLANCDFIKPLIGVQTKVGETNVMTSKKIIKYFATKGGYLIPCTEEHLAPYNKVVAEILDGHHNLLIAQSLPVAEITDDGAEVDMLYSALVKEYFSKSYLRQGKRRAKFMAPVEAFFAEDCEEASAVNDLDYHKLALYALADAEIDQIVAFHTTHVERFFKYIEANWQQLLQEISCTTERKAELEAIFVAGFGSPIAQKLWRNLTKVVAYGAGELHQHTVAMKKYTGSMPHSNGYYFTEEAILGKAVADDTELFECPRGVNYYELLPQESASDAAINWSEATVNNRYALVVTNRAGLYRFVTDHIVCPKEVTADHIYYTIY